MEGPLTLTLSPFRLLVTEPLDGAANMALDEALLLARLAGSAPATLRFFGWDPPTVSLGYGQPLDGRVDLEAARRMGVGVVRRPTGGSAILHEGPECELTYSVTAAAGDFPGADDLLATYQWIGRALEAGLAALGAPVAMVAAQPSDPRTMPAFCFARTGSYELEVGGLKVVGSAQRRQGTGFLQHGAVMLAADRDRLTRVFPGSRDPLAGMTTLEAVLGRRPTFDETQARLADAFSRVHGLELRPGGLTDAETAMAETLARDKYGAAEWTRAGRVVGVAPRPSPQPSPLGGEGRVRGPAVR